jgi:glyoxylase-like metal-dependent hydrolase (beta-lactamase superfamily II)
MAPTGRSPSLRPSFRILLLLLPLACSATFADSTTTTQRKATRLAEGIYTIRHPDAPDTFPQGNTTVIIGAKAVLVVDSCLLPSSATQDIRQIRQWTDKPVTYLVNTHWHFDHTLGNATYAAAFPSIQIVAHEATRDIIARFNPGVIERYPGRAERFRKVLDSGKNPDGSPLNEVQRRDYERSLAGLAPVVAEMKGATQLVPNVSFRETLDIDLGNRPVRIRFLGPGNTAGDTILFLPNEKILVTGDLLDHPVPYFFGGLPVDFPRTLAAMAALDAQTVVPGHGDVLKGKKYIQQVIDLLTAVNREIEAEVNRGMTLEEVQQAAPTALNLAAWRRKFAGTNKEDGDFFDESVASLIKTSYNQIRMR